MTLQALRFISISGAFLVGFWIPLKLIDFAPNVHIEILFDLLVSIISAINIWFYFQKHKKINLKKFSLEKLGLLIDFFCFLPFSLISLALWNTTSSWILVINILCVRHIRHIKSFLDNLGALRPVIYRLVPIFVSLPLLVHLVACGWIALGNGNYSGDANDTVLIYVKAIYWSFTTLTTVGYGDVVAQTIPQMLYSCGVQVIGVGVFGYILSNVASLLSRVDAAREHHMDNLDRIETFMNSYKIPHALRNKTRDYFRYLWQNKKGYNDHSLLEDLPAKLQSELLFEINKTIVHKVPFLKEAESDLIENLMDELEPKIFIPGEKIFRVDDPADALYFIHKGSIEIISRDNQSLAHLHEGAFFGEMALLTGRPRNATAIATTYCDLFLLHREVFNRVLKSYPTFEKHIHDTINIRK